MNSRKNGHKHFLSKWNHFCGCTPTPCAILCPFFCQPSSSPREMHFLNGSLENFPSVLHLPVHMCDCTYILVRSRKTFLGWRVWEDPVNAKDTTLLKANQFRIPLITCRLLSLGQCRGKKMGKNELLCIRK